MMPPFRSPHRPREGIAFPERDPQGCDSSRAGTHEAQGSGSTWAHQKCPPRASPTPSESETRHGAWCGHFKISDIREHETHDNLYNHEMLIKRINECEIVHSIKLKLGTSRVSLSRRMDGFVLFVQWNATSSDREPQLCGQRTALGGSVQPRSGPTQRGFTRIDGRTAFLHIRKRPPLWAEPSMWAQNLAAQRRAPSPGGARPSAVPAAKIRCASQTQSKQCSSSSSVCLRVLNREHIGLDGFKFPSRFSVSKTLSH